jgi:phenylpropionate dioxygenase-like ring-hydroxylating dioxygenase large terminal subunit
MNVAYRTAPDAVPGFEEANTTRQRARAAGLDPDYWYAVELDNRLRPGQVVEVVFWQQAIALFRGEDGEVRALTNRCAHRQLKLSLGQVNGCKLQCVYHGWMYDCDGRLTQVPHEHFGDKLPNVTLRTYPVQIRYGLIWIFPGDPSLAHVRTIPRIPELEGPDRWACEPLVFVWKAHHSILIDNVSDFTHAHLHRKYRPFGDARLTRCETDGDRVHVAYDTEVGYGRISRLFVDHQHINTRHMELCYEYPYQWSNTDDQIKHWLFVLPVDERTTKAFFLFYFKSLKVPLLPLKVPRQWMHWVLKASNRLLIEPLLRQDQLAVEAEQAAYETHWKAKTIELTPVVRAFQQLTIRKWRDYLQRSSQS